MKTTLTIILTILFMTAFFGNVYTEEIAKEGSGTEMHVASGKLKMLALEEGTAIISWKQKGVMLSDSGDGPFHNMSENCVGVILYEKGVGSGHGYCIGLAPDGDKILFEVTQENMSPGPGLKKGKFRYIAGTGKFAGIQGGGEYSQYAVRPAEEGTYQNVTKSKSSYKLP